MKKIKEKINIKANFGAGNPCNSLLGWLFTHVEIMMLVTKGTSEKSFFYYYYYYLYKKYGRVKKKINLPEKETVTSKLSALDYFLLRLIYSMTDNDWQSMWTSSGCRL